jgi:hypothetical protein
VKISSQTMRRTVQLTSCFKNRVHSLPRDVPKTTKTFYKEERERESRHTIPIFKWDENRPNIGRSATGSLDFAALGGIVAANSSTTPPTSLHTHREQKTTGKRTKKKRAERIVAWVHFPLSHLCPWTVFSLEALAHSL